MSRAIKYLVPGLLAFFSIYMYLQIYIPTNLIVVSIEKNGLIVFISGIIILGFIINSFEHYLRKLKIKTSRCIYGKKRDYELRVRIIKEIQILKKNGDLNQNYPEKLSEQTKSDFWMWVLRNYSANFQEIILRQSLGSMYLFFSCIFLLNFLIIISLLISKNLLLTPSMFLTMVLILIFTIFSFLSSNHYDSRFNDYYAYYFKKYLIKYNNVKSKD